MQGKFNPSSPMIFFILSLSLHFLATGQAADIDSARGDIETLIEAGDFAAAESAIEQMKLDFATNASLAEKLCQIAYKYEKVEALERAGALNSQVVANFPTNDYRSYAALQLAKLGIYELIDKGDYQPADSAVSQMATDFSGNVNLARRLWEVANRYDKRQAFGYAKTLSTRIATDHASDVYGTYAALLIKRQNAYDLIDSGDYDSAYSAISQIENDFAGHKQLCRRLWEIANRFDKFKAFKHSKMACERILADYPRDEYASYARLQLAKLEIYELIYKSRYEPASLAASKMMEDFAGHKQLPRRLYEIAQMLPDAGAWEQGKALHNRIAAVYPNDKYGSSAAIQAAKLNVYGFINSEDMAAAENALSHLKNTYANHELLFSVLESVAEKYAIASEHKMARAVYQQVTQQCPSDHKAAVVAKAGLGRCDISSAVELGNESTADAITSRLLSELADSEYQREAVHSLAYGLYTDLLAEASKTEESALVANYAMRIISLLENQLLPLNLPIQVRADAYLMLAECYYRLGVPTIAREYYQKHYNTSPGYRLECYSKHMVARCLEDELKLELVSENKAKPQIIEIHQNILSDYPECDAAEYAQEWLENNPQ